MACEHVVATRQTKAWQRDDDKPRHWFIVIHPLCNPIRFLLRGDPELNKHGVGKLTGINYASEAEAYKKLLIKNQDAPTVRKLLQYWNMQVFPQFLLTPDSQDEEEEAPCVQVDADENPGLDSMFCGLCMGADTSSAPTSKNSSSLPLPQTLPTDVECVNAHSDVEWAPDLHPNVEAHTPAPVAPISQSINPPHGRCRVPTPVPSTSKAVADVPAPPAKAPHGRHPKQVSVVQVDADSGAGCSARSSKSADAWCKIEGKCEVAGSSIVRASSTSSR
ncbi:uncharacterized protein LACBIDRAFT_333826 [Laccaria bicolor S238N-H82]|uniref:Predicted protein n=1 Tax=Laccaria bicolor (strain S238N-H82 / ATCC MYA-4686) TaxID=486041 RepID=B0DX73_LACBS|nr:uncharacterized protein LACBIDRAFT_333826 [Laccaria bicolor S238N-H82]EDR00784.1 predicted protein [Laccaria bicolor S238N-H82]|eukprot:XP_001888576.1 predicted protein [Laccaria bicolor S238N-H82]